MIDMVSALLALRHRTDARSSAATKPRDDLAGRLIGQVMEDLAMAPRVINVVGRTSLAEVYRANRHSLNLTLGVSVVNRAAQRAERGGCSDAAVVAAGRAAARRYAALIMAAPLSAHPLDVRPGFSPGIARGSGMSSASCMYVPASGWHYWRRLDKELASSQKFIAREARSTLERRFCDSPGICTLD
jgi:hypothetical protein